MYLGKQLLHMHEIKTLINRNGNKETETESHCLAFDFN